MSEEVRFQELIAQKEAENRLLQAENERQSQEIRLLKQKIDLLIRRLFGSKSEKLDAAQLELVLKDLELGKAVASAEKAEATPILEALKPVARASAKKQRRERWPEDLPIEQEVIEPAEVRDNPEAFRCIGEEVTEMLDYQPRSFFAARSFAASSCAEMKPSLLPSSLHCLRACSSAVLHHRVYWHKCSLVNIAIINRFIGRNRFTGIGIRSGCHARVRLAGSNWPVSG